MGVYYTHWTTADGKRRHIRLYMAWRNVRTRVKGYTKDGTGRAIWKGLSIGWADFYEFRVWSIMHGYRRGVVLDRKESHLGYGPGNCQWITSAENANRARTQHKKGCKCFWCRQRREK